jgi:hypothetical protein
MTVVNFTTNGQDERMSGQRLKAGVVGRKCKEYPCRWCKNIPVLQVDISFFGEIERDESLEYDDKNNLPNDDGMMIKIFIRSR